MASQVQGLAFSIDTTTTTTPCTLHMNTEHTIITMLRAKLCACLANTAKTGTKRMNMQKFCTVMELNPDAIDVAVYAINCTKLATVKVSDHGVTISAPMNNAANAEAIQQVFAHWQACRASRVILTDKRRRVLAARMREGYTAAQMCAACDAMMANDFNTSNGFTDVEHFAGTTERLDRWLLASASASSHDTEAERIRRQMAQRR